MSALEIKHYPFVTLRQPAAAVDKSTVKSAGFKHFTQNLMETLEGKYPLGAGLAANQVGKLLRVFAVNLEIEKDQFMKQVFINPEIVEKSANTEVAWEGCLSFPDQWGQVRRSISVKVRALNPAGQSFESQATNFYARLLQHEIDHLDGVLFIDKLESDLVDTARFEELVRQEQEKVG